MEDTEGRLTALQLDDFTPELRSRVAARLRSSGIDVVDDGHELFVTPVDLEAARRLSLEEVGRRQGSRRSVVFIAVAVLAIVAIVVGGVLVVRSGDQAAREDPGVLPQGAASCVDPVRDQTAGGVSPRPAVRAESADIVSAEVTASAGEMVLTASFVAPPVNPGTAIYSGETTAASVSFDLYVDPGRRYGVSVDADLLRPQVGLSYFDSGEPGDGDASIEEIEPPQDATWAGDTLTVRIPLDLLELLPQEFEWSLIASVFEDIPPTGDFATGSSLAMDQCGTGEPVPLPSEDGQLHRLRFPDPSDEPASSTTAPPLVASTSTSTTLPPASEPLPTASGPVDLSSQTAVASRLVNAWNSSDRDAALEVAPEDVVDFLFAEERNTSATFTGCRHSSQIADGEFQAFATFVCEGTFGAEWKSDQSIELYVDGGASGGYSVTSVGFNRNPPGWRPVD
ncbi:hypothetical protein BH10ACT3_BH10ACT3_05470 [soil metagenome]